MLNAGDLGISKFLYRKLGVLYLLGITKKAIIITMILAKEVENILGPPICVQHSEVLRLLLGKLVHWT